MKQFIFLLISLLIYTQNLHADLQHDKSIRMAIFDNPQPDPSNNENTQQYVNAYLAGINTAITVAASKGIYIYEKEFFHKSNLANIIQQASDIKAWSPNIVMGLSTSNDFIMSKAFFNDQMVLSISATDPALTTLPQGFYSLGIPDTNAVNIITKFIHNHYPNANVYITAAAESKESVDFSHLLAKTYKKQFIDKKVFEKIFLIDDLDNLTFTRFLSSYTEKDVIVIMSIGYSSAIDLMNKIAFYINPVKPVFITSADNWGDNTITTKMMGCYDAFRIDTLFESVDTKNYKTFYENYLKIYHHYPNDKISFITYQTVMSFVDSLLQNPIKKNYK